MSMAWVGLAGAGASLAGSIYSSNKNADAMAEANSGELPEWLKPYVTGDGAMPGFVQNPGKTNTRWLDYIQQLGQGNNDAQWNPMSSDSIHFNPEQQFTPVDDGSPYGALPPGMNAPPTEQAPGGGGFGDVNEMEQFFKQRDLAHSLQGEGGAGYLFKRDRSFPDMEQDRFSDLNKLYDMMNPGRGYSNNG